MYKKKSTNDLIAYTDSDYIGDLNDRKSTSGYVFLLSSEVEFVAAVGSASQVVWMRRVLDQLGHVQKKSTIVMYDNNSSTIKLSKNPVTHGRSKHIDIRFHFLRELANDGIIKL